MRPSLIVYIVLLVSLPGLSACNGSGGRSGPQDTIVVQDPETPDSTDDAGGSGPDQAPAAPADTTSSPSTPHNERPLFSGEFIWSAPENTAVPGLNIEVSDADGDPLTLTMSGDDAAFFTLNAAELRLETELVANHESPEDSDRNNEYVITLTANDGLSRTSQDYTLIITDEVDTILEERGAFVLTGSSVGDAVAAGTAVSAAGDADADNRDDVAFSLPGYSLPGNLTRDGRVLLMTANQALNLTEPVTDLARYAQQLLRFDGGDEDAAGSSLALLDVDRDDRNELLISSPLVDDAGRVDMISDDTITAGLAAGDAAGTVSLPDLPGTADPGSGLSMVSTAVEDARLGERIASAGDINGDGILDLLVCVPGTDRSGLQDVGRAYVVFGDALLAGGYGLLLDLNQAVTDKQAVLMNGLGQQDFEGFCSAGAAAGDVNGDGFDDLLVVAAADDDTHSRQRNVYLFSGLLLATARQESPVIDLLSELALSTRRTINFIPETAIASDGLSLGGGHDFNNDGFSDILIGDPLGNGSEGRAYLIYGASGFFLVSEPDIPLSTVSANGLGVEIRGDISLGDFAGQITQGRDMTGDNVTDVLITARPASGSSGLVYVLSGSALSDRSDLDITDCGRSVEGLVIRNAGDQAQGMVIAVAGDVDGDQRQEVLIGSPQSRSGSGLVYLISGELISDQIATAAESGEDAVLDLMGLFPELDVIP